MTTCQRCQAAPKVMTGTRLPRGWKHVGEAILCPACLHDHYLHRAVTVPIASPIDATWGEFGAALKEAWVQSTACANWIVTTLYVRDIRREATMQKLPSMTPVYLYPEARAQFPQISPINLTALLQQVERTYREQRYELLWTGTRSLAVHRYPVPTPIHAQALAIDPPDPGNGWMTVRLRLGDRWWALRLRGGAEFARQRRQLLALQTGTALMGAGALLGITARTGDHRHREDRRRVLLKLTGWFPRPVVREASGVCRVVTAASDFCLVHRPGHTVPIHGDLVRRQIRLYEIRRGRAPRGLGLDPTRQADRIKTLCQEMAALIARWAREDGRAIVSYEDDERGFCDPFPWTKWRLWLQSAIENQGLRWEYASDAVGTVPAEALAINGKD